MRGGLSTIDRDYGMFNKIQHDIGTHVVHHLFPQIPHYHLTEATAVRRAPAAPPAPSPEPCIHGGTPQAAESRAALGMRSVSAAAAGAAALLRGSTCCCWARSRRYGRCQCSF